ncbi:MAG: isochorismatase family protein [Eggerthellaceae bacterium]|nr:isochorismatase family protein [Eggerthellaceae bacterium]
MYEQGTGGVTPGVSRRDFVRLAAGSALGAGSVLAPAIAYADEPASPKPAEPDPLYPYAVPVTVTEDELRRRKRVLVVVDYQVDFVDGGVFGTVEPALAIEDDLYALIKDYQDAGDIVVYTQDTHPADTYDATREATINPPHCIPGTEGWEIYGRCRELLTPERAIAVRKGTYGSKELPSILEALRSQGTAFESIEVAGVSTTCRVLHNAILLYTFFPEVPVIMDARTTASYTDDRTMEQLRVMEGWGFIVKW